MINPRDIFDAHRVVQAPNAYRRRRLPLPGVVIPPVADPERRSTVLRVIRRTLVERTAGARASVAQAAADARARLPRRG